MPGTWTGSPAWIAACRVRDSTCYRLHGISHNHRSDLVRSQARPLKGGADGCRSKLNGRNILQRAAECPDGCANWFGNHDRVLRCHEKTSTEKMKEKR
jgi:hypothetical protein